MTLKKKGKAEREGNNTWDPLVNEWIEKDILSIEISEPAHELRRIKNVYNGKSQEKINCNHIFPNTRFLMIHLWTMYNISN
jgi:hypothetical protein